MSVIDHRCTAFSRSACVATEHNASTWTFRYTVEPGAGTGEWNDRRITTGCVHGDAPFCCGRREDSVYARRSLARSQSIG